MTSTPALESRAYRDLIGRFATGVTVITTQVGDQVRAMTANAISSVSLDPLLVLVCIERRASLHDLLLESGVFAVNILDEDQRELSDLFARRAELDEPMGGVSFSEGSTGSPLIEGVIGWIDCEVWRTYDGGDHTIVVGRVVDMSMARPDARPLLFFSGRYRSLGDEL
jgi:flavin reductase (DIM6/NTAB) family NADH-FMN oxidoreductase RutF